MLSESGITFQNFNFLTNFGENCLVDEPGLHNLYKNENILILFISLILWN